MLRDEPNCFTFTIENTTMLCKGHPKWDLVQRLIDAVKMLSTFDRISISLFG